MNYTSVLDGYRGPLLQHQRARRHERTSVPIGGLGVRTVPESGDETFDIAAADVVAQGAVLAPERIQAPHPSPKGSKIGGAILLKALTHCPTCGCLLPPKAECPIRQV